MFRHEKFAAYRYSIEFAALATQIIERLPEGHAKLVDQLRSAAISSSSSARKAKALLEKVVAILLARSAKKEMTNDY